MTEMNLWNDGDNHEYIEGKEGMKVKQAWKLLSHRTGLWEGRKEMSNKDAPVPLQ